MTLGELAATLSTLGVLGLVASRFGLSAIPAYLVAGILLGPHEPHLLTLIEPSEVTEFVAELGLVFLLFFLGLEFTLERFARSGRHFGLGGSIDLVVNAGIGLLVGVVAFGFSFAALVLAAAVYVSSSAVAIKGLIDFRRLADEETDLVLAVLVFQDIVIAFALGFAATGGGAAAETLELVAKALAFITAAVAASRWLAAPLDLLLARLPREFLLLFAVALVAAMAAASEAAGMSEAIGALLAGVLLARTSVREEIEERFVSFRDIFAALFFFVFGLSIDIEALGRVGWLLGAAIVVSVAGKLAAGYVAGLVGGFSRRQSVNAATALVARGEFTIIVAQLASVNPALPAEDRSYLVAFAGLYVLATAAIGVVLMKESRRIGRYLFPPPTLEERT